MPRIFKIASIVAHVLVAGGMFVAQLFAVGPLPIPHTPITFVGAIPIVVVDLPPPRARTASSDPAPEASANLAPLVAPDGVAPEPPRAMVVAGPPGVVPGIDGGIPGFGTVVVPPPPPPPPPPQPPQPPMRLHSGMQAPRKIANLDPVYPRVAQTARIEGVVILEAVIDARGHVESVRVLRSIPLLDQSAVDAVKGWVFTPALLNGLPVPVVMTVTVNFTLDAR